MTQKYDRQPLNELELARVNEISFNNMLRHFADKFGAPAMLGQFLNIMATYMGESPDNLNMVANKSFRSDKHPYKPKEMIEIYYRSDFSRRDIMKMLQVGDRRVTQVIKEDKSHILAPEFTQREALVATKFVRFFADVTEEII